jgi:hypothetical protein
MNTSDNGYPSFLSNGSNGDFISAISEIGYKNGLAKGKQYPSGKYVFLYEGEGKIQFEGDASQEKEDPLKKKIWLNINASSYIGVRIIYTNPNNPLKNFRLIPEEFELSYNTTNIFSPSFLNILKPFKTLRFCGWQNEKYNSYILNIRS